MKRITSFLLGSLFCSAVVADDNLLLDVNGYSWHSRDIYTSGGMSREYNSMNTGLGLTKQVSNHVDVSAGVYENSYYKTSVYGCANFHLNFGGGALIVRPGVSVGIVTGYDNTPDNTGVVRPIVLPSLVASFNDFGVRFGFVPPFPRSGGGSTVAVVTVQFQYRVD